MAAIELLKIECHFHLVHIDHWLVQISLLHQLLADVFGSIPFNPLLRYQLDYKVVLGN
jgi:hypothetical protein